MYNEKTYGKIFKTKITKENEIGYKIAYDMQIFFVISGTMLFKENDKEIKLRESDFLFVTQGTRYSCRLKGKDCLLLKIKIDYADFCELFSDKEKQIRCNSAS